MGSSFEFMTYRPGKRTPSRTKPEITAPVATGIYHGPIRTPVLSVEQPSRKLEDEERAVWEKLAIAWTFPLGEYHTSKPSIEAIFKSGSAPNKLYHIWKKSLIEPTHSGKLLHTSLRQAGQPGGQMHHPTSQLPIGNHPIPNSEELLNGIPMPKRLLHTTPAPQQKGLIHTIQGAANHITDAAQTFFGGQSGDVSPPSAGQTTPTPHTISQRPGWYPKQTPRESTAHKNAQPFAALDHASVNGDGGRSDVPAGTAELVAHPQSPTSPEPSHAHIPTQSSAQSQPGHTTETSHALTPKAGHKTETSHALTPKAGHKTETSHAHTPNESVPVSGDHSIAAFVAICRIIWSSINNNIFHPEDSDTPSSSAAITDIFCKRLQRHANREESITTFMQCAKNESNTFRDKFQNLLHQYSFSNKNELSGKWDAASETSLRLLNETLHSARCDG